MALPKIKHPTYTHYLHGLGREITFRPFTIAEQKVLLLAKEDKTKARILESILQILRNCIQDSDIVIEELPLFDIEDIFLRIRAKSVGEKIDLKYSYEFGDPDENGNRQKDFVHVTVNIDDVAIKNEEYKRDVIVDDIGKIGIRFNWPTFNMYQVMGDDESDDELMYHCIDFIYDEEQIYNKADSTKEEMMEFIDDIDAIGSQRIQEFFKKMPHLHYETEVMLPKLEKKEKIVISGITDFFQ